MDISAVSRTDTYAFLSSAVDIYRTVLLEYDVAVAGSVVIADAVGLGGVELNADAAVALDDEL